MNLRKLGVKGSDVYTEAGVGNLCLTFFTQLVRGLEVEEIRRNVGEILKSERDLQDLLVLAFQTRDVR